MSLSVGKRFRRHGSHRVRRHPAVERPCHAVGPGGAANHRPANAHGLCLPGRVIDGSRRNLLPERQLAYICPPAHWLCIGAPGMPAPGHRGPRDLRALGRFATTCRWRYPLSRARVHDLHWAAPHLLIARPAYLLYKYHTPCPRVRQNLGLLRLSPHPDVGRAPAGHLSPAQTNLLPQRIMHQPLCITTLMTYVTLSEANDLGWGGETIHSGADTSHAQARYFTARGSVQHDNTVGSCESLIPCHFSTCLLRTRPR